MRFPLPHPDLMDLSRLKPCRSLECIEVIGPWEDMTVEGIPGFCRACYDRLTEKES